MSCSQSYWKTGSSPSVPACPAQTRPPSYGDAEEFDTAYCREYLKNKKLPIKQVLLDQSFVAGIGNIYMQNCSNSGDITVSYSANTTLHCAGGITGLHEGFKISGCSNTGALNTTLNCPTGGLIGLQLDATVSTGEGCTVVCDITSGQASTGGMLVGVYSGTAAFTMGSSSNPIKVAGSINGAAASASNLCGSASASQPTFNTNL